MYTKYDFVFYLNLKSGQVLKKIDTSEYVIQFTLRLNLFQMKNMMSNRKKTSVLKIAKIVAFSSRRPYATK